MLALAIAMTKSAQHINGAGYKPGVIKHKRCRDKQLHSCSAQRLFSNTDMLFMLYSKFSFSIFSLQKVLNRVSFRQKFYAPDPSMVLE